MFLCLWEILGKEKAVECVERFACETEIVSGDGVLGVLAELSGRRLFVVADSLAVPGGGVERIRGILKPETMHCFDRATPEPTMAQAVEGARQIKGFHPDLVVAMGGTHVVDCAKAMVCFSHCSSPLVVIATEPGSGTEVTGRVSLFHEGSRHTLQDRNMGPEMAVLDSSLMKSVSSGIMAEGGFLLLANSLESYAGQKAGMITRLHAREAFVMGWGALPAAFSGNSTARGRLQIASVMSGMAYDRTGLGLCHALVGSLGSVFHLSPGKLAGILLPSVISCNAHVAGRQYAELARAAGMGGSNETVGVRNLKVGLSRLRRELGMPATLAQAGINPRWVWSNVQRIVELTLGDPECRNNVVAVDDFLIRRILEEITGHF